MHWYSKDYIYNEKQLMLPGDLVTHGLLEVLPSRRFLIFARVKQQNLRDDDHRALSYSSEHGVPTKDSIDRVRQQRLNDCFSKRIIDPRIKSRGRSSWTT
uniref:uncharacterized protein LOC127063331 isoform X1 n=1 Tax=Vespula vulgaris TaxID=7454 RepID=UPI00223C378D|nr:uncharacterized protein LOC127063331 isoform X1 [Vespula vulgaris]